MTNRLKLMALDRDDLTVISASVQDAVVRVGEIQFLPAEQRLIVPIRRFAWEAPGALRRFFPKNERRLAVLHFDRVTGVKMRGIDRSDSNAVLSILALTSPVSSDPEGLCTSVTIDFSGGAAIALEVECIEAQLTDLDAAWAAQARPRHRDVESSD